MLAADRPIPAAPCPTCQRPQAARSGDVGRLVRCDGCGTRFRIALVSPTAAQVPVPDEEADGEPTERPARPRAANPYDDGYGRFEVLVRPGRVTALATMHFVYCGLLSVCGILSSVLMRTYPSALPGPDIAAANRLYTHALHGLMVVASVVLVIAGTQTLRRSPKAWVWSWVGLGVAGLLLLLSLVDIALNLPTFTGMPGETIGVMVGVIYQLLFWLGYMVPVGSLLGSIRRDLDPPAAEE